jgi:hypothetical protein
MIFNIIKYRKTATLLSFAVLMLPDQTSALPSLCAQFDTGSDNSKRKQVEIDYVWSGTKVEFSAAYSQGKYYVAYYNADRAFTIAEVDPISEGVRRMTLPNKFDGWDSHNYTMIESDESNNLIVSGNMHATKLVYFLIDRNTFSIKSRTMIGRDEDRVTYPTLLRFDNRILFLYRDGGSGDGAWLANEWRKGQWSRLGAIFSGSSKIGHVSAYPTRFVKSPDGFAHVATVWRRTPDVATNYVITYAKTRDFRAWISHTGQNLTSPLDPDDSDVVISTGESAGLTNNPQIAISPDGRPVITYTAYNQGGVNTVYLAQPDGSSWKSTSVATAAARIEISGFGSIPASSAGSAVDFTSALPFMDLFFSKDGAYRVNLDPGTLAPVCEPSKIVLRNMANNMSVRGLVKPARNSVVVRGASKARIEWSSQGVNNDRARECTASEPRACDPPPSRLVLSLPAP